MKEQRKRVDRLLRKMPSLRSKLDESITDAYGIAIVCQRRDPSWRKIFRRNALHTVQEILGE
jgi:hypothetical protein